MDIFLDPQTNDIAIKNGKPAIDNGLQTAVYISLFTDARAENDDEIPDGSTNRRGWWGDALEDEPLGSRLWLLSRSKITNDVLGLYETYSKQALDWLISEGAASEINVSATRDLVDRDKIILQIGITKPNGLTETFNFALNWTSQEEGAIAI